MKDSIHYINKQIEDALSASGIEALIHDIAEPVLLRDGDEKTIPAIRINKDEFVGVLDDADEHDVVMYHRLNSEAYTDAEPGYGDYRIYGVSGDVSLVVFGKLDQYDTKDIIVSTLMSNNNVVLTNVNFNPMQNWASEFQGIPYYINPEFFLIKINYKLLTAHKRACVHK